MKYTDRHHILTGGARGRVRFSQSEIDAAIQEMQSTRSTISSIQRDGFAVGLTQNKFGAQLVSAYAGDFWVGLMNIEGDGSGCVQVNAPMPAVFAAGTTFQKRAAELAGQESVLRASPDITDETPGAADHDVDIGDLRDEIAEAGLYEVKKVGMHLTDRTLSIFSAGGSASERANAIASRYQAILDNPDDPDLIQSIVLIEKAERAWKAGSKNVV